MHPGDIDTTTYYWQLTDTCRYLLILIALARYFLLFYTLLTPLCVIPVLFELFWHISAPLNTNKLIHSIIMNNSKTWPSQDRLNELFTYNPETGKLTRKATGRILQPTKEGYIRTSIDKSPYLGHRRIWKTMTGEEPKNVIDHIIETVLITDGAIFRILLRKRA